MGKKRVDFAGFSECFKCQFVISKREKNVYILQRVVFIRCFGDKVLPFITNYENATLPVYPRVSVGFNACRHEWYSLWAAVSIGPSLENVEKRGKPAGNANSLTNMHEPHCVQCWLEVCLNLVTKGPKRENLAAFEKIFISSRENLLWTSLWILWYPGVDPRLKERFFSAEI